MRWDGCRVRVARDARRTARGAPWLHVHAQVPSSAPLVAVKTPAPLAPQYEAAHTLRETVVQRSKSAAAEPSRQWQSQLPCSPDAMGEVAVSGQNSVALSHFLQNESHVMRAGSAELVQRAAIRKKSCTLALLASIISTYEVCGVGPPCGPAVMQKPAWL